MPVFEPNEFLLWLWNKGVCFCVPNCDRFYIWVVVGDHNVSFFQIQLRFYLPKKIILSEPIWSYSNLSEPIQRYPNISKCINTYLNHIWTYPNVSKPTLDSGINIGVRLSIFGFFSTGYVLIKDSNPSKKSKILLFDKVGYFFFKGPCLLFFPNVPGAMFIQGATLIPESRVPYRPWVKWMPRKS